MMLNVTHACSSLNEHKKLFLAFSSLKLCLSERVFPFICCFCHRLMTFLWVKVKLKMFAWHWIAPKLYSRKLIKAFEASDDFWVEKLSNLKIPSKYFNSISIKNRRFQNQTQRFYSAHDSGRKRKASAAGFFEMNSLVYFYVIVAMFAVTWSSNRYRTSLAWHSIFVVVAAQWKSFIKPKGEILSA